MNLDSCKTHDSFLCDLITSVIVYGITSSFDEFNANCKGASKNVLPLMKA
jgi:hypothetical protein